MKFVPELSQEKFRDILFSNPLYSDATSFYKEYLELLYPLVAREIFAMEKPFTQLNYPEQGGVTGYFSANMKKADLALVQEFLKEHKIDPLNTRAFLKADGTYEITVGSIHKDVRDFSYKDRKFKVINGEFGPYLEEVVYYLDKAKAYAANDC
jgi:dipeptidyl-peptidase-3